jgi:mannose/fructose/N-acetylgalactosamine-specific phosphotransferase system component IID
MTTRRYLSLGLLFALLVLGVGLLFGADIAAALTTIRNTGVGAIGILANIIADPLIWAMVNPIFAALIVLFAWPFLVLWILLLFLLVVLGYGADAARDIDANVSLLLGWM